jgi:spoIIIJ-associated protein
MTSDALKDLTTHFLSTLGFSPESVEVREASMNKASRATVVVVSSDAAALLANNGEPLRALNALARRMVEKQHGETAANFLIDINGYHEQQLEAVRANARMLAQRARLFKQTVEMPPMSSYERLVVHELFAEDPEIETRSEGEGKLRHIVLAYKGAAV